MNQHVCIYPTDVKYVSGLSTYFHEFSNDPTVRIISAKPTNCCFDQHEPEAVAAELNRHGTEITKFIFYDVYEGIFCYSNIEHIHKILQLTTFRADQFYYISGAINGKDIYAEWRIQNNIGDKIHVYSVVYWASGIIRRSKILTRHATIKVKKKLFLCFNRTFRKHRGFILGMLLERNLVKDSFYSFFIDCDSGYIPEEFKDKQLSRVRFVLESGHNSISHELIDRVHNQFRENISIFPLLLNIGKDNVKILIDVDDLEYYNESYFSLVTETSFFKHRNMPINANFFSEKIYKPILMKHPFILASSENSLLELRKLGYKTFHPYIDETYDTVSDDENRLNLIINEVERLSKFLPEQWIEWQNNITDILEHNHRVILTRKQHEYVNR